MEEQRNISDLLDQIPQPGFLVQNGRIQTVNPAAGALLFAPGQELDSYILTGQEEYAAFQDGQLCLTLTVAGHSHSALITRLDGRDLILLEEPGIDEEFRSMALVSMELRQPLMQAILNARQLEDPAAAKLNRSLMHMLRTVSNMADIGRYTASARMEMRDVDAFVLELFEKAAALAGGSHTIHFEGLKQPLFSLIDPEQLERAVWNLLSNAIKFTPARGTIRGSLIRQGHILQLSIEDSGSGIAEAARTTLFHRYLRQPGIEDSRFGLGLGLAIVRAAAANHGGTVLIRSVPNGGTKVTMTLAIRQNGEPQLRSPLLRPDYTGGFDHGLVELADCLHADNYTNL